MTESLEKEVELEKKELDQAKQDPKVKEEVKEDKSPDKSEDEDFLLEKLGGELSDVKSGIFANIGDLPKLNKKAKQTLKEKLFSKKKMTSSSNVRKNLDAASIMPLVGDDDTMSFGFSEAGENTEGDC